MRKLNKILWGIVLVAAGLVFALNALGVTNIEVFFDGWWTLFIIIPCLVGFITEREKTGNFAGLAIGIFLLLCAQDILEFDLLWKLILPAVVVILGLRLIFSGIASKTVDKKIHEIKLDGERSKVEFTAFSGSDLKYDGEVFDGAELTTVFGGIKCDLRNAIIEKDTVIKATAIFGGIDILVPEGINVKASSISIFGGMSNKAANTDNNTVTLYVSATCMFGGVDIK